ncbi:MAG: sugar phosphate isomerase/epimerase [Desulfobacteraceae bacterium]|nr:sugar phosphate isomerase/epimerase [Desulfobacteraceae bacterium]
MNHPLQHIIRQVQVNAPIRLLKYKYLKPFIKFGLNPEIGIDAMALDRFSPKAFSSIADEFIMNGRTITMHAPFWDLPPGSPDSEIRRVVKKRLDQTLKLIPVFAPKTLVCHAGYDPRNYSSLKDDWIKRSVDIWGWLSGELEAHGTQLMLENVHEGHPEEMLMILEPLHSSGVRWCMDAGHQSAFSSISTHHWMTMLFPYLGQVHLHDNNGRADEHLALGKGCIDFNDIFGVIRDRKLNPVMTIEPHAEPDLWASLTFLDGYL